MKVDQFIHSECELLKVAPCWGVKNLDQCRLDFNFGQPRLKITEPGNAGNKRFARETRKVDVEGEIKLILSQCEWHVRKNGEEIAHNLSDLLEINDACAYLDGQILTQVHICPDTVETVFTFDLGGELNCKNFLSKKSNKKLWYLYKKNKMLCFDQDGVFEYSENNKSRPKIIKSRSVDIKL